MCTGKIVQYVPRGFTYREVEGKCGQTGIHGVTVYCDECEADGKATADRERIWDLDHPEYDY